MSEYTGPVQPSKDEWEVWYQRMKNMLHPIQVQGFAIACHPDDRSMVEDMLERLAEDETWRHESVPPLIVSKMMKPGQIQPADPETAKAVHMRQVVQARSGFGRFGGLLTPSKDGLHDPWKATKPKDFKPPKPDASSDE